MMKWLTRGLLWSSFALLMMSSTGCLLLAGPSPSGGCTDDADCSSGYICSGGSCVSNSTPPPSGCTGDGDCQTGYICASNGSCAAAPPPGCNGDADCNNGYVCANNGACVAPPPPVTCEGNLLVLWRFNGVAGCPDDAEDVILKVFDPSGRPLHQNVQGDSFPCTNGENLYKTLSCGTYQVKVQAVDGSDSFTWNSPQANIDIIDGRTAELTVDLQPE